MPQTNYISELSGTQIEAALEAVHGVVTPSNNGKVLCIEDGKIAAKSASEWGGGGYPEPTGTIQITANGTVNVKDYETAEVNVPSGITAADEGKVVKNGVLVSQTARATEITANGTYDTTENNSVTVNVSGGGGGINAFGLFSLTTRNEGSMAWQKTVSSLNVTWNGASLIGADSFAMIDLTDVSSISVDVATGNSYTDTNAKWYLYLALMDTDPKGINYPANQYQTYFNVYDEFHTRNSSATLTIDVSGYTGLNYLIISAIGWTAEFTNLVIS